MFDNPKWGDQRTVYYVQWMVGDLKASAPFYETEHEAKFGAQLKKSEGKEVKVIKALETYRGGVWTTELEEEVN